MCLLDWGRHNTTLAAARCLQTACQPARLPSDIPLAAHSVAIIASLSLAACLRSGAEGPRWSLQEVRGLEACTERALQLCKSWLPADLKRPLQQELTRVSALTDQQAAEHPGQPELPSEVSCNSSLGTNSQLACSGCGQPAWQLRKCSP